MRVDDGRRVPDRCDDRRVNSTPIRDDLLDAQRTAWSRVTSPGSSWSGEERAAVALLALAALDDPDPAPPWVSPAARGLPLPAVLPEAVCDVTYRLARHASTLTVEWYRNQLERGLAPIAYVELVGIVAVAAAVDGFYRAIGQPRPALPSTTAGSASGSHPPVEAAMLNWVPVAVPADRVAAVVQALSATPDDFEQVKVLAAAQYIPFDEMGDLAWNRGTLARSDMELVASRLSRARECFY